MTRAARLLSIAAATTSLLAAGCYGDGHEYDYVGPPPGPQALVQVVNTSPDAPPLTLLIDGTQAAPTLDYAQGTAQLVLDATQSHTVTLQGLSPGAPTTLIGPLTESFSANTTYRILIEGSVASIAPATSKYPQTTIAGNMTRVQWVHAAPSGPSVSIYLTAPGASLASSTPVATLSYQGSSGPTDVASGPYEIRITPAGATSPVFFDSGSVTLLPGADLLLAAVQNLFPTPIAAPFEIAAVDQDGNNTRLVDVSTPAALRIVHDVADGGALGVYFAGNSTPIVSSLTYPNFSAYINETAGFYTLDVTPASNPAQVLLAQDVDLDPGTFHTLYVGGPLASIGALVTHDHNRRVATYAKLRLIQGAPSATLVDIYVAAAGSSIAGLSPTYQSVPLGGDTGSQPFAAGSYDITITAAGSKTPLLGPTSVTLANSGIYTAVARDAPGGGAPLGLIELDDL